MAEPMSSARRAEICEALTLQQTVLRLPRTTHWMARELLAEVNRLLPLEAELQKLRAQLERPGGICGTTFGGKDKPIFICTLPPGHFPDGEHKNGNATAWVLDTGYWTVQRGPSWANGSTDD